MLSVPLSVNIMPVLMVIGLAFTYLSVSFFLRALWG